MNGLERRYDRHLLTRHLAGEVFAWRFEGIKLRLADKTFYEPDFSPVILADGSIEIHEVKGFWEDDARVKIKVAAEQFPFFKFIAVKERPKREGGGWQFEEF